MMIKLNGPETATQDQRSEARPESRLRRTSTRTWPSGSAGLVRVLLHNEQRSQPRILPHLTRVRSEIDPGLRAAVREVCEGRRPWPLLICGPAGCGKTRAGLCLVDAVMGSARYATLPDLCHDHNEIRAGNVWYPGARGPRKRVADFWREVESPVLLVVDEIGARQNVSDAHFEVLKGVLDAREGRPLVAITNLDLQAIARVYDDRVASRLAAGTVVALDGADRRLQREQDDHDDGSWPTEYPR